MDNDLKQNVVNNTNTNNTNNITDKIKIKTLEKKLC
jgi:hypothetical protein